MSEGENGLNVGVQVDAEQSTGEEAIHRHSAS